MFVLNIIKNALHDIFVGLANSLDDIKGKKITVNIKCKPSKQG